MNRKHLIPVALLGACLPGGMLHAQDVHFSQFYDHGMVRNPALTGIYNGDYKAAVNYRNQWSEIGTAFQTLLVSAETRMGVNEANDCFSYGFTASADRAGSVGLTTIAVMPSVSYNKSLGDDHDTYLSAGFSGAYIQRSVDISKMTFASQLINGEFSSGNPSNEQLAGNKTSNWDLSAGVSVNSFIGSAERKIARYYLGIAAYHITKPRQSFFDNTSLINLNTKWSGQAGCSVFLSRQAVLSVHANYYRQYPHTETVFGGFVGWLPSGAAAQKRVFLQLGLFNRLGDALIPAVKLDYQTLSCTFSYDINNSSLQNASGGLGGPEISLICKGIFQKRELKEKLKCPSRCPRMELLDQDRLQ